MGTGVSDDGRRTQSTNLALRSRHVRCGQDEGAARMRCGMTLGGEHGWSKD